MKIDKIKIKNNIALNVTRTDKFKMSRLSVAFIYDAHKIESPKKKLTFSTLMRGSTNYPTVTKINCALDDLFGTTVIYRYSSDGDRHVFTFVCEMLEEKYIPDTQKIDIFGGTLHILHDILFNPLLLDGKLLCEYVDSEKKIALDNIRAKINDQRAYSASNCKKIMFAGENAGIAIDGDEDIVSAFDCDSISECYDHIFDGVRVECHYVGSKSSDIIVPLISEFLSKIPETNYAAEYGYTSFESSKPLTYTEEKKQVTQGRLNIGMTAKVILGENDYYAMSLFNEIFGGASTSKLFMNVREKNSLCYYCSSVYLLSKGAIFVSCGVNPENKDKAYDEILRQLAQMKAGNITLDEIETAKKLICASLRQVYDSPSGIDGFTFRRTMAGISETPEEAFKKICAVTYDDIVRVAQYVEPNTVYFLYGDEEDRTDE